MFYIELNSLHLILYFKSGIFSLQNRKSFVMDSKRNQIQLKTNCLSYIYAPDIIFPKNIINCTFTFWLFPKN